MSDWTRIDCHNPASRARLVERFVTDAIASLRAQFRNDPDLTPRDVRRLEAFVTGEYRARVAEELEATVRRHLARVARDTSATSDAVH